MRGGIRRPSGVAVLMHATLAMSLAGCSAESGGSRPAATVDLTRVDSSGIEIFAIERFDPAGLPAWSLTTEPRLTIGSIDGPPGTRLFRVVSATRLSDGRLVVANAGTSELRFFAADGRFLAAAGGEGDGPGEFGSLSFVAPISGDTVLAYDRRHRRATIYGPNVAPARSWTMDPDFASATVLDAFPDGSLLLRRDDGDLDQGPGPFRPRAEILRVSPDGRSATFAVIPGNEAVLHRGSGMTAARPTLFGRGAFAIVTTVDSSVEAVVAATNDEYGYATYTARGPVRIVRVHQPPRPVNPGRFEERRDSLLATSSNDRFRAFWRELFDQMPRHATHPAFLRLMGDASGRVWVEEVTDDDEIPREWTVFEEGRPVAHVETPRHLQILEIGADEVIGLEHDELGTERVAVYGLVSSSSVVMSIQPARVR